MTYYYQPKCIEKKYISDDIKIIYNNDFYKIIAINDIKKGTIIMKETSDYNLFGHYKTNQILDILYLMLKNKDDIKIINLYPRNNIKLINQYKNPYLIDLLKEIKYCSNNKIKKFLLEHDNDTLYTYYYKILFNAFDMYGSPVLLFNGAMINHSCTPNVKFYESNNTMYFETLTNVKKGEEITYSYLRNVVIKTTKEKHLYLLNHYNFKCQCSL
jgi:hypothetical protein